MMNFSGEKWIKFVMSCLNEMFEYFIGTLSIGVSSFLEWIFKLYVEYVIN